MKNRITLALGMCLALLGFANTAWADSIVMPAIFGSGNTDFQNGNLQNGVTVGLQAKVRDTGAVNTTNGIDFFVPIGYSSNPARSAWQAEIEVATPGPLNQYAILWFWETDPSAGYGVFNGFDLLAISDNSYGLWGVTGNGQGLENNNPAAYDFVGQSWNSLFFGIPANTPGIYTFLVDVYSFDQYGHQVPLSWGNQINVHVEAPPVPEASATISLVFAAFLGIALTRRFGVAPAGLLTPA
ncbi:MAG: hypothetical protein WCV82_00900 [Candidatus Paceibacterota bacterium]